MKQNKESNMTWFARTWNPWHEVGELQREVNRMFAGAAAGNQRTGDPGFNVWKNENGVALTAELPGFSAEDLDITVVGRAVTVSGQRKPEAVEEGDRWYRRERRLDSFTRTVELPFEVDPRSAEASYDKGVLTIRLNRPEEQKARKIAIKAN